MMDVLWKGIVEGCDKYGYDYTAIQGIEIAAQADALAVAIDEGVNMVFYLTETEELAATQLIEAYPDVTWVNIDSAGGEYFENVPENSCALTYKEHEAAFLNGVFAAKLSKTGKVAQNQGTDKGTMIRFNAGFRAGVMYELGYDPTTVAVGFTDVNKAYETAVMLHEQGVDVFACCAASSNLGVFQAAEEYGFLACGAADGQFTAMPSVIPASQVKTVDRIAVELIDAYAAGEFPYGEAQIRGIAEDGVDLIYTDQNDELLETIPQEVFDYVDSIRKKIADGEIEVPDSPEALETFTARAE